MPDVRDIKRSKNADIAGVNKQFDKDFARFWKEKEAAKKKAAPKKKTAKK